MATDCPARDACDVLRIEPPSVADGIHHPDIPFDSPQERHMSRPTFVRAGAAVIAVAAATSLAACGGGGGGGGSSQSASDTLTIGLNADAAPGGYDPQLYSAGQFQFFSSMYDALFVTEHRRRGRRPAWSRSSRTTPTTPRLTLTLKDGVTFTDGSTLDSTLVKAQPRPPQRGQRRAADQGHSRSGRLDEITDVTAPDPKTVVITWARPQARRRTPWPTPPAPSSAPTASRTPTRWRRPRTAPGRTP